MSPNKSLREVPTISTDSTSPACTSTLSSMIILKKTTWNQIQLPILSRISRKHLSLLHQTDFHSSTVHQPNYSKLRTRSSLKMIRKLLKSRTNIWLKKSLILARPISTSSSSSYPGSTASSATLTQPGCN